METSIVAPSLNAEIQEMGLRITELEVALQPLAALIERPWDVCEVALQSVNRFDVERAVAVLKKGTENG